MYQLTINIPEETALALKLTPEELISCLIK